MINRILNINEGNKEYLVNYDLLTKEEIFWLNNYHNKVYEKISNNLDRENRKWLKKVCTPFLKS